MPPTSALPLPRGYVLEERLGRRAGVEVLRARRGAQEVLLRLDAGGGESEAELSVLAEVRHPGIAPLVDHGPLEGGGTYVARAWVAGADLLRWSAGRTPEEIGAAVARTCAALEHLHRLGFVHADLKPENVIVASDGSSVLCDFGLARREGARDEREGASGTFFSIAPEVILGASTGPAADLFALGTLLHRLLAGTRTTAREFYARFPGRSFLDAIGSRPEDLPVWARDLVVALTARDPARRPRSAAWVGRTLAARLGLALDALETAAPPRVPIGLGRDAWLAAWLAEARLADAGAWWLATAPGDAPDAFLEHVRLFAALRGQETHGVDLGHELAERRSTAAVEALARALSDHTRGWLVALVDAADAWQVRAAETLARSAARAPRSEQRDAGPRLIVVAASAPPAAAPSAARPADVAWERMQVPPVAAQDAELYLRSLLAPDERRDELVGRLRDAAAGSATRLDHLLRRAFATGLFFPSDEGLRLRPGPLPAFGSELVAGDAAALSDAARSTLAALFVAGGEARPDELAELAALGERALGAALLELTRAGHARLRSGPQGLDVAGGGGGAGLGSRALRTIHARLAARLERADPRDPRARAHRFCAAPDGDSAAALAQALQELRDDGCPELALELFERVQRAAPAAELVLERDAPELLLEHALAWCTIGRTEQALETLDQAAPASSAGGTSALAARAELVRAQIDARRHRLDEALASCARACELAPALAADARIVRLRLLHDAGRDREVLEDAAALVDGGEGDAVLTRRKRVTVESLRAMSAFRLGLLDEARARTERLLAETTERADGATEAALRINLATIERRAGSMERARAELERSIELYDRGGLVAGLAHARAALGGLLRELGELRAAEPLLAAALETRLLLGDRDGAALVRGMLGLLWFERGHARAAILALDESAAAMPGAQGRRHTPLLCAKADEMRSRIGAVRRADGKDVVPDPRVLLSRARTAWLDGDEAAARAFGERAASLADELKLSHAAEEARSFGALFAGRSIDAPAADDRSLAAEDLRLLAALAKTGAEFERAALETLANELESRGRDDRAARIWYALAARASETGEANRALARADECFRTCAAGLTADEETDLRLALLGIPDPWPGDFTIRPTQSQTDQEFEMEVVSLLEINRRLVAQEDLHTLLGVIVESALDVTGAERGLLVLEEHGELRFDTALDSCRGDLAQPELEISRSVVGEALERMQPIRVSNAVDDPLLGHTNSVVSLELRSILCVPIQISDGLRAAIYVDHRLRTGAFDERAERLCTLLASQAALAIQQVRRLGEIKSLAQKLERRVTEQATDLESARKALLALGRAGAERGGLIGGSDAMKAVADLLERAGPSDIPVLVVGQSGTGKELAARRLHELSRRAAGPYVSENCAALPPTLIESELFGYRRGAFTGADRDREGVFERAHGGTLFLDEIGELPLELQAKLLRVLEMSEVRRIGDAAPRKVDFRLVAATNRDLEREVREGRFREDLFFRLDSLRVEMPPLSERVDDVPILIEHFLAQEKAKDRIARRVSKPVMTALCRRSWPGNVRELKNEIARLCVLSEGDLDDPRLVKPASRLEQKEEAPGLVTMAELERQAILRALEHTGGDKRRAASILGISRAKIYQRLKEWGETEK